MMIGEAKGVVISTMIPAVSSLSISVFNASFSLGGMVHGCRVNGFVSQNGHFGEDVAV